MGSMEPYVERVSDSGVSLQCEPGLHALIAGVSKYPHLMGGDKRLAEHHFGLHSLSCTALSAYKIYQWLNGRDEAKSLPVPLASVRLLLSPSEGELAKEPAMAGFPQCTLGNFQDALEDWRREARSHRNNMTFLYIAGHGIGTYFGDTVFLLEDFGDGRGGPLGKAVTTSDIYDGMVRCKLASKMAGTQLYFLDMCRTFPPEQKEYRTWKTAPLWKIPLPGSKSGDRDDRNAPRFYASLPNDQAYTIKDEQTIFSKVLLDCLNNDAGDLIPINGEERWLVSVGTLTTALHRFVEHYISNLPLLDQRDQQVVVDGVGNPDTIIHFLGKPPDENVVLTVDPDAACNHMQVKVTGQDNIEVWSLPAPLSPHPYKGTLKPGYYRLDAKFSPPTDPFMDHTSGKMVRSLFPKQLWAVEMSR